MTLPDTHPRATGPSGSARCIIQSHAIVHPDGVIVVDTGPDMGHPVIDELYQPQVRSIVEVLNADGLDERDVTAVINTHLHFDHCGQNHRLPAAPVWATAAEVEAAKAEFYTVPEWAEITPDRLRLAGDGEEIAPGVRLLHTPGHTPGHQSVSVAGDAGPELLVGQTCYCVEEFVDGIPADSDMHDESWLEAGHQSLQRLLALRPAAAHFSHDHRVYEAGS